jgi:uncharacterized cupredoxin-like copper-binding protein
MHTWKRGALVWLAGMAALAAVAAACGDEEEGEEGGGGGGTTVNVTLGEWLVEPDPASAPAGSITFVANNEGSEPHELVIVKTDLAPGALPTKDDGSFDEEAAGVEVIDEIEEFEAGGSESITVDLAAGKYVLLCNLVEEEESGEKESHYEKGMHAAFTVE